VKDSEIVNASSEIVRLRGFYLGGWMNMENFIIGYPGHEFGMRAAVAYVLGDGKYCRIFSSLVMMMLLMWNSLILR
jgi:endoglucanase